MKPFQFIGWQHHKKGYGETFFPMFNIFDTASPLCGSTVSFRTLVSLGYLMRGGPVKKGATN